MPQQCLSRNNMRILPLIAMTHRTTSHLMETAYRWLRIQPVYTELKKYDYARIVSATFALCGLKSEEKYVRHTAQGSSQATLLAMVHRTTSRLKKTVYVRYKAQPLCTELTKKHDYADVVAFAALTYVSHGVRFVIYYRPCPSDSEDLVRIVDATFAYILDGSGFGGQNARYRGLRLINLRSDARTMQCKHQVDDAEDHKPQNVSMDIPALSTRIPDQYASIVIALERSQRSIIAGKDIRTSRMWGNNGSRSMSGVSGPSFISADGSTDISAPGIHTLTAQSCTMSSRQITSVILLRDNPAAIFNRDWIEVLLPVCLYRRR